MKLTYDIDFIQFILSNNRKYIKFAHFLVGIQRNKIIRKIR